MKHLSEEEYINCAVRVAFHMKTLHEMVTKVSDMQMALLRAGIKDPAKKAKNKTKIEELAQDFVTGVGRHTIECQFDVHRVIQEAPDDLLKELGI